MIQYRCTVGVGYWFTMKQITKKTKVQKYIIIREDITNS